MCAGGMDARLQDLTRFFTVREIPRLQRRALARPLDFYRESFDAATAGMAAACATGDYTLQPIADAFGVHYSTASRAVSGK